MSQMPSPPFVDVPGIANFRDAGGHLSKGGKHVRRGLIYRSADPSKATEEGLNKMGKELGKVRVCRFQPDYRARAYTHQG